MATHTTTIAFLLLTVSVLHAEDKPVVINSVAAKNFAAQIQPILSNTCAECHARADLGSTFLLKKYDPNYNDPKLAEANLKAFTALLDTKEPSKSIALQYAIKAHGKAKTPPLRDASHPAYTKMELWLYTAVSTEGTAMYTTVPQMKKTYTEATSAFQLTGATEAVKPSAEPARLPMLKATPLKPADEFDPIQFNRPPEQKKK